MKHNRTDWNNILMNNFKWQYLSSRWMQDGFSYCPLYRGTAQVTFVVDRVVDRHRKWRDRKWRQSPEETLTGSMFCACATDSCAIFALVGPFHRKWHHRNRKWKGEVFPRISRVFSWTPLDSRYEQWNCESNLYRVTIALLSPMLNHFSLLNCAVSRDYLTQC